MFDAILEWNMTTEEAEAFRIAKLWEKEVDKITSKSLKNPEWYRRNRLPRRSDPRNSNLFRYCWKLRRETRGLLEEEEIPLYITANLTVLKSHNAYIEINTLCGDKAWIRWKIWKRLYDEKMAQINHNEAPPICDSKLTRELLRTKKFIYERCDGEPCASKIKEFIDEGVFKVWVLQGKISIFYLVLSSYTKPYLDKLAEECPFDPKLYQNKLTEDVVKFFDYEFKETE